MCCRVGACCYITDLRVATIIIAVLCMLGNMSVVAFNSWCFKVTRLFLLQIVNKDSLLAISMRCGLALLAVLLILSLMAVCLDVMLFVGAIRRRREMVQNWTHGHAVVSGAYLLYFWMLHVSAFANGYILYGFLSLVTCSICSVLSVYFWAVVRSYHYKLYQTQLRTVSGSCNYDKPPPYSRYP